MSPDLTFSIGLDVLIAILLAATIVYAVSLSRKLNRLRDSKAEMDATIAHLIEATDHARAGLEGLRAQAAEVGEGLQQALSQSRGRADELAFLVERAEALSRHLDGTIAAARAADLASPAANLASPSANLASPSANLAPPSAPAAARPPNPRREPPPEEASLLKSLQGIR